MHPNWNKNAVMRITNILLYFSGCFLAGTGFLIYFRLPPGSRGGKGLTLFGMDRHEWGDWHLYVSFVFILLSVYHLWLNRAWLIKIASAKKPWRLLAGFFVGITIIIVLILSPVEHSF